MVFSTFSPVHLPPPLPCVNKYCPVAEFINPDRGDTVNSRPTPPPGYMAWRWRAGTTTPMSEMTLSPSHGSMNSATGLYSLRRVQRRGEGIRLCGEHLQELYTVYLTRFRTYKICLPPQSKTIKGRGPQTDKHLPPSPFTQVNF